MPYVEVNGLRKKYRDSFELRNISFHLGKGEVFTLMGPSGSGKTSLLRNICGLDTPDAGSIVIDGREVNDLPTTRRGIGLIFQDLAIFPHMTVFDNIAYGLRAKRAAESEVRSRVMELSSILSIEDLLDRYPSQVSGGQRQRIALARSVAPSPSLLLLDEPLSSLDQQLRADVRSELKSFSRELGLTMIYVTHDHHEGLYMADSAGIIFDGRLEKSGSPMDIFESPGSEKVSSFLGYNVISLKGRRIAFYPTDFEISMEKGDVRGVVRSIGYEGEFYRAHVETESHESLQLTFPHENGTVRIKTGQSVNIILRRSVEIE